MTGDIHSLEGSRCPECGETAVPPVHRCPACLRGAPCERIELSGEGRLTQFTVLHTPTGRFAAPYVVGFVALPEGPTVYCRIEAADGGAPTPVTGASVRLVAEDGDVRCVLGEPARA